MSDSLCRLLDVGCLRVDKTLLGSVNEWQLVPAVRCGLFAGGQDPAGVRE